MKATVKSVCLLLCFFAVSSWVATKSAHAFDNQGSIKGVVRAKTGGSADSDSTVVPNAKVTLTNVDLAEFKLSVESDDSGSFIFENVPAAKYLLTIEAAGLATVSREITLASGATLLVDIDLSVAVSEQVMVRNEEGLLSTSETTTSNIVRAETLTAQPFREEEFQSALALTPGVVRGANNDSFIKGARAGQSNYTINGADVSDPVTGEPVFEIPLEAVANIQIEENPYSAEFGQFTGGVTQLQSKGGGDKFKFQAARFFPTFHNYISSKVDSFRPRITLSGPIIKDKLYYLQSFEYRYRNDFVPSLKSPLNRVTTERLSAFSQLDYAVNKANQIKFNFALYPQKTRFFNLNTFNPAETTPNLKQRGYLVSLSEQSVFKNTSFLNSAINYNTADFDVFAQGNLPLTTVSDVNRGNYFADTRRRSKRFQLTETYFAAPFELAGKHSLKIGAEYQYSSVSSKFSYNSILFRTLSLNLTQRIDFTQPERRRFSYSDFFSFAQDRWVVSPKLTLDLGLRFDRDGVGKQSNLSPRFSFLFDPLKNNRTIIRGGIGLFYDETLPVAGYFSSDSTSASNGLPERTLTTFAADGVTTINTRKYFNQTEDIKTPQSVRWSIYIDQSITKNITARFGYLARRGKNDLLIDPILLNATTGVYRLSSNGRSRYHEFQALAAYSPKDYGTWNISYTYSKAQGDLNTADVVVDNFPVLNIRPNEYARLPFDTPHRFLAYGQFKVPYDIQIAPLFEYRTGFPFSAVNDRYQFVGSRNLAGRFPDYLSLDVTVTKGFRLPFLKKYKIRAGAALFNLTQHFNPRDIQNNINNPNYGNFYNSQGLGVKAKFDVDL